MKNKTIGAIAALLIILAGIHFFIQKMNTTQDAMNTTETIAVKQISNTIFATGTIESENQTDMHFQTAGKLTWLPLKEGDPVQAGQVIARLDSYALQRQLMQALNTYKSTQDTADQLVENKDNGVLEGQQRVALDTSNKNAYSKETEVDVINNEIKRIADQNQNTLDNANINVELANYAITLSSITAPFDGIITHEDVTSAGVNITPTTTFSVADPNKLVFRANVSESDINFIAVGGKAIITLNGSEGKQIQATVTKIYPQKTTLPSGENVYKVDIQSDQLTSVTALKTGGSVLIDNKYNEPVALLPAWLVLNRQYVWVMQDNKPVLRKVTIGNSIGDTIEIRSGLSATDQVIIHPKAVIKNLYTIL